MIVIIILHLLMDKERTPNVNTTKEALISNIKDWMALEKDIKRLKLDVKTKTITQKKLSENLTTVMTNNSIDCFAVNGGSIIHKKKKTKKTISGKYLLAQLELYFQNKPEIARDITNQVLDNREETIKDEITLKTKSM